MNLRGSRGRTETFGPGLGNAVLSSLLMWGLLPRKRRQRQGKHHTARGIISKDDPFSEFKRASRSRPICHLMRQAVGQNVLSCFWS
ncbi:hypothetical protein BDV10DRAFT_80764 [Aspergillus recurvatus]